MDSWSNLPEEIVEKIAGEHLETYSQLIAFSKVSKFWRSIAIRSQNPRAPSASRHRRRICLPGLIVSKKDYLGDSSPTSYKCQPRCEFLPLSVVFSHEDDYSDENLDEIQEEDDQNENKKENENNDVEKDEDESDEDDSDEDENDEDDSDEDESDEDDSDEEDTGTITTTSCEHPPSPPWWRPAGGTRRKRRSMCVRKEGDEFVELEKFYCVSAKDGWLVLIEPCNCSNVTRESKCIICLSELKMYLFNPITGDSIHLPPLIRHNERWWDDVIQRFIVSSSPDDPDCHIILVSRYPTPQLAWCKVQDGSWKFTGDDMIFDQPRDATYFGGKLYVIDGITDNLRLHVLDDPITTSSSSSSMPAAPRLITMPSGLELGYMYHYYLAELNGQLLLVARRCYTGLSVVFDVYKLVSEETGCWEEVTDLEGHAMFLGDNQSFCIPSHNNEDGIRDSCIYFAFNIDYVEDIQNTHKGHCGMFSLRNGNLQVLEPSGCFREHSDFHYVWFLLVPSW